MHTIKGSNSSIAICKHCFCILPVYIIGFYKKKIAYYLHLFSKIINTWKDQVPTQLIKQRTSAEQYKTKAAVDRIADG